MMKKARLILAATLFSAAIPCISIAADNLHSQPLSGAAPSIDGIKNNGEWSGAPSISLRSPYPIDTDIYFRHDNQNLYVLVDATGDVNDNNLDECLLVFGLPPNHKIAEMWRDDNSNPITQANASSVATAYAMGMTAGHRTYEFRIPFANLGIQPGQPIPFYSPRILKGPTWYGASIPYDAQDGRDNEYPNDLLVTTGSGVPPAITGVSNYSTLYTQTFPIPTFSEWGAILLSGLLAIGAAFALRRQRK